MDFALAILLVMLLVLFAVSSASSGSRVANDEECAISLGLTELKVVTDWLAAHAAEAAPAVALVDAAGGGLAFQARNMKIAQAAQQGSRVDYACTGAVFAVKARDEAKGGPAEIACLYLSGLELIVLDFYVSEPTYRILASQYERFVEIVAPYVSAHPGLMTRVTGLVLRSIAEDLRDVDLGETAEPLLQALARAAETES